MSEEKRTDHFCCYESDIPHGVGVLHECRRARDCKHGHLARSCEICDLESRLAEKERVIERYREALLDIASDKQNPPYYDQGAICSFFTAFRLTAKSALQEGEGGK